MATEFEELKLTVTLVDNATAGVQKLRQQLGDLGGSGGGAGEAFNTMNRQTADLGKEVQKLFKPLGELGDLFKPLSAGIGEAASAMPAFASGILAATGSVTALGFAFKGMVDNASRFAKDMVTLGATAQKLGVDPATYELLSRAFQRSGVSAQATAANLAGLSHAYGDLTRVNSETRRRLLEFAGQDPAAQANMMRWVTTATKGTYAEFVKHAREYAENVRKNSEDAALARHESPDAAARRGASDAAVFTNIIGAPDIERVRGELRDANGKEKQMWDKRIEDGREFNRISVKIGKNWERIWNVLTVQTLPMLTKILGWVGAAGKAIAKRLEAQEAAKAAMTRPERKKAEAAEKGYALPSWFRGDRSVFGTGLDLLRGKTTGDAPAKLFGGESYGVSGDADKAMEELTVQAKRLADDFEELAKPRGGQGAGTKPYGMLSTGFATSGGVTMRGLGGLPGVNATPSAAPSAAPEAAPNAPPAAPAAPNAPNAPPAPEAAPSIAPNGGGAARGTPSGDFVSKVKKFEGFAPRAQWDYKQFTSGYGTKASQAGEPISKEEAEKRLHTELDKASTAVDKINPNLDAGTRGALTDLVFNAGPGALKGIHGAIAKGDTAAIKAWLPEHYTTAGGKQLKALVARRAQEATWVGNPDAFGDTRTAAARADTDAALAQRVEGNANINVDVSAPKGSGSDRSSALFKQTDTPRQKQMEMAPSSNDFAGPG